MFGHDPELPNGFQDADLEMREFEEEAERLHRQEKKKKTLPPVYEEGQHDNTGTKEPTFGTKDFANGSWGNTASPEKILLDLIVRFGPRQLLESISEICKKKGIYCSLNHKR